MVTVGTGLRLPNAEPDAVGHERETSTRDELLMDAVVERENMRRALKRVQANKGSGGIDGMEVSDLPRYLKKHWPRHREQLLNGTYRAKPVRHVEIPKRSGGTRKLGVPTVMDRLVQQAILQVLQQRWESTFSEYSYGFRPGRSAHQAIAKANEHVAAGHIYVVDIDLENFFDEVCHDRLMGLLACRITDKRVLATVRSFLRAGIFAYGMTSSTTRGTPQGGPLSPLLSNIVLDQLDQELERRGHRFCRYADDCGVYVRSRRAGERVMRNIKQYITRRLGLKVNEAKSAVAPVWKRQFLGFSFVRGKRLRRSIAPKALAWLKDRLRRLTRRTTGRTLEQIVRDLQPLLRGWRAYFRICETPSPLRALDSWVRRRLRSIVWKRWKTPKRRLQQLRAHGVRGTLARNTAATGRGPWHVSGCAAMNIALPNSYFDSIGLPRLEPR